MKEQVSLWRIFCVFAKIGAFTIGGGYAMIPLIERELNQRGWLPAEELPDIVAMAQSAPGILAVNMSIFAGFRLRGLRGAIVATLGSVLPSFIAILLIAMVFTRFKDNPIVERIFKGIRPVVVALIAVPMISMARSGNRHWWSWLLSVAAMVAVALLKVSPVWILLVVIVLFLSLSLLRQKKEGRP